MVFLDQVRDPCLAWHLYYCFGFNFVKATAHAKVLNFTSNVAALLVFILGGKVVWSIGLVMLVGQFLGANLGAKMVLTKGKALIRPMVARFICNDYKNGI